MASGLGPAADGWVLFAVDFGLHPENNAAPTITAAAKNVWFINFVSIFRTVHDGLRNRHGGGCQRMQKVLNFSVHPKCGFVRTCDFSRYGGARHSVRAALASRRVLRNPERHLPTRVFLHGILDVATESFLVIHRCADARRVSPRKKSRFRPADKRITAANLLAR
jgi:hypothetical protein